MSSTSDGFAIAEEDLKLRGPGDFFGSRQHGLPSLRVADLSCDLSLLHETQSAAEQLLAADPSKIIRCSKPASSFSSSSTPMP